MKKLFMRIVCVCLAAVSVAGFCACGGGKKDGIQISAVEYGYGLQWLKEMISEFEKDTGINVELVTKKGSAGEESFKTEIESGDSYTDLFFSKRGWFAKDAYVSFVSKGKSYDCLYADLTDVWNSASDGKTIKEKMYDSYADAFDISGKYYALPWAGGVLGIVRNLSVWTDLGLTDEDVPYTTDELFALCDKVVAKDKSPFICSLTDDYYAGWTTLFFAQYEGKENAEQFMKGLDPDGELSQYLYTYGGQTEALKVLQKLVSKENGKFRYQYDNEDMSFSEAQSFFARGVALFMVNGSWLETEAKSFDGSSFDMIKTPVISSIVKKLSFKEAEDADEKLRELIKYVDKVDAGETAEKPDFASEDDVKKVTEARHYSYMVSGTDHYAYVPSYSSRITEAKEFLKFMYSDKGLNIYYKTLKGATLPATPVGGYDESVTLSNFMTSVNKAAVDDYTFNRTEKAKIFVMNNINAYSFNGLGSYSSLVRALLDGKTPEDIINMNCTELASKWDKYQK